MPIIHEVEQRSAEWDKLRLGIVTSSCFHMILTPGGKPSEQWKRYAYHLIAERLLQRSVGTYTSPAMERGQIVEADAADWYELTQDVDTRKIGFIMSDDGKVGASPDRLVGDDGLLEIKCPEAAAQVEYLLADATNGLLKHPLRKYWPQVQGQLYVAERQWVDVLAWSEELPSTVIRVERDEPYIEKLAKEIASCNREIERVMGLIDGVRIKPKAVLREMLQQSLEAPL